MDPTLIGRLGGLGVGGGEGVGVKEGDVVRSASSVVVVHNNGHMVPASGTAKVTFKDFMVQQHKLLNK